MSQRAKSAAGPTGSRRSHPPPRRTDTGSFVSELPATVRRLLGPRLVFLFLCGSLLFGYPILGLFSSTARIAGIPLLFVYLFAVWAALIAAIAALVEPRGRRKP